MRATRFLAAVAFPAVLTAQDSTRVVPPGTSLRVHVGHPEAITGRAVASTDSSLTLQTSYGAETFRYALIQRTELRRGSAGKFAAISGLVGATIGVTAAIVFKDFGCQSDPCDATPQIGGGIFFGGVPAAIIGGFIGAFVPRWTTTPGRISVVSPGATTSPTIRVASNECGPGFNGNASLGITNYGTGAVDGSIVVNCQPGRTLFLSAAFVSLPDRTSGVNDLYRTDLARASLGAERFIVSGLRASFSIDGYREAGTRYLTSSKQGVVDGGLGFGLGLSAAKRITGNMALRGAGQLHARPNSNRDAETILFFGIERSARRP